MATMIVKPGDTDVSVYVFLQDAVTGGAYTSTGDETSLNLIYTRDGAAQVSANVSAALASADAAHEDGKVFHVGNGLWRCDFADAAFAAGADRVALQVTHDSGAFLPAAVGVDFWSAKALRAILAGMAGNLTFDDGTGAASFKDAEDGATERISYTVSSAGVGRTGASVS